MLVTIVFFDNLLSTIPTSQIEKIVKLLKIIRYCIIKLQKETNMYK